MIKLINVRYGNDPRLLKRELRRMVSQSLAAGLRFWRGEYFPVHFTTAGARRYNYAARTKEHMIRKARKQGHQRPLVWTGESERELRARMEIQTFQRRSSAKGKLRGPRHFFILDVGIDKVDELTRTTQDEETRITTTIETDFRGRMARAHNPSVTTIRPG